MDKRHSSNKVPFDYDIDQTNVDDEMSFTEMLNAECPERPVTELGFRRISPYTNLQGQQETHQPSPYTQQRSQAMHPQAMHQQSMHPQAMHQQSMHPQAMHQQSMHPQAMHQQPQSTMPVSAHFQAYGYQLRTQPQNYPVHYPTANQGTLAYQTSYNLPNGQIQMHQQYFQVQPPYAVPSYPQQLYTNFTNTRGTVGKKRGRKRLNDSSETSDETTLSSEETTFSSDESDEAEEETTQEEENGLEKLYVSKTFTLSEIEGLDEEEKEKDDNEGPLEEEENPDEYVTPIVFPISHEAKEALTKKPTLLYLAKYRGSSHLHCEWITEEEILQYPMGTNRIKRFVPTPLDESLVTVERVLKEENDTYLIKWEGLGYEYCTFEGEEVKYCPNFENALQVFRSRTLNARTTVLRPQELERVEPEYNGNMLREYQIEGVSWLMMRWQRRIGCIVADEMGLGKTVQSVVFLRLVSKYVDGPFLIVTPLSTIKNWERELKKWTNLYVIVYHGTNTAREVIAQHEMKGVYVLVTTYEMVIASSHLRNVFFKVGIFDEAHRLKNSKSKASIEARRLALDHCVLLTGTPLQNNMAELWSMLNFVMPREYPDCDSFCTKFSSGEGVVELQRVLRPLMLRRVKSDVESSIPAKEETLVEVELTTTQKRYYRAIVERNVENVSGLLHSKIQVLHNIMMELRKCCIHPFLIKGAREQISEMTHTEINNHSLLISSSGKLVLLDKLLAKLYGEHKVLIFSQMTKCLDLLEEYCVNKNYVYERIDGGVRADLRQEAIDRFSTREDSFVFLLCTRAGGVGINLIAADTVVIFDSDWNPQNDIQAQARCHRIGQTKCVKVYRLVTRNTYEKEMFQRANKKLGLERALMNTKSEREEIERLLRHGVYGVLHEDDENSVRFCEESIDQILDRRATVLSGKERDALFNRASFKPSDDTFIDAFFSERGVVRLSLKRTVELGSGELLSSEGSEYLTEKALLIWNTGRVYSTEESKVEREIIDEALALIDENKEEVECVLEHIKKEQRGGVSDSGVSDVNNIENQEENNKRRKTTNNKDKDKDTTTNKDTEETKKNKTDDSKTKPTKETKNDKTVADNVNNTDKEDSANFSLLFKTSTENNEGIALRLILRVLLMAHIELLFADCDPLFINERLYKALDIPKIASSKSWTHEHDRILLYKVFVDGFTVSMDDLPADVLRKRLIKILYAVHKSKPRRPTVIDVERLYEINLDKICPEVYLRYGAVTDVNRRNVPRFARCDAFYEFTQKFVTKKNDEHKLARQRIELFKLLSENKPLKRTIRMPKGWTEADSERLREVLLAKGLDGVSEFKEKGLTEEIALRRMDALRSKW